MATLHLDTMRSAYDQPDEFGCDVVVITADQLAAVHRLAEAARHVARLLPADARRQLLDAADQVHEA